MAAVLATRPVATQNGANRGRIRINGHEAIAGEVLVQYRQGRASAAQARVTAAADADEQEPLTRGGVVRLHSRGLGTAALLALLQDDPDVEFAEPNYVRYLENLPNDPSLTGLWGLLNTGFNTVGGGGVAGADIDAASAWNTTTGSRNHVVGVIDTGVDYNQPDLVANMWSAPSAFQVTVGGATVTCQAGTRGFNAVTRTCTPLDDDQHGTHAAGTIGAVGDNAVGVVGVNWVASWMALKFLSSSGSGSTSDAVLAIEFAIQAKAAFAASGGANDRVLSNSWGGGGYSAALANAVTAANEADMLFVVAAGNSAPTNDTVPTYPSSLTMAAPHVSGAAVLALSMCAATTAQLEALLVGSVDVLPDFSATTASGGRLNVARSIDACQRPRVTAVDVTSDLPSPQPPNTTVTWTATASGGEAPYQYQWAAYDGTTWTTPTGWQTATTFTWTPAVANASSQVAVRAKGSWNTGAREMASTAAYAVMPAVTSLTLTSDVDAPRAPNTTITWTAAAGGGQAPSQYQFAVWDGTVDEPRSVAEQRHAGVDTDGRPRRLPDRRARPQQLQQRRARAGRDPRLRGNPARHEPHADADRRRGAGRGHRGHLDRHGRRRPGPVPLSVGRPRRHHLDDPHRLADRHDLHVATGAATQVAVRAKGSWNAGARELAATVAYAVQ